MPLDSNEGRVVVEVKTPIALTHEGASSVRNELRRKKNTLVVPLAEMAMLLDLQKVRDVGLEACKGCCVVCEL